MVPLLLLALAQSPADAPAKPPPKADAPAKPAPKPAGPPEFELLFTDGGNVRAAILEPAATVTTRYGKLTVPFADLKKVELGFRYPAGVEEKVAAAVARLGAAAFRDREEAEKELLGFKEYSLAAVRRAAKGGDPEVVRRAEPLLKKLLATVPADRREAKDYDTVETAEFTVKGRLELDTLRAETRQFGEVQLRVELVKAFRTLAAGQAAAELTLDASLYGRPNWQAWYDTGIDLAADKPFEIACTGTIDLLPMQPGQQTSGPAGNPQVMAPPLMMVNGPNGVAMRVMGNQRFASGMVVGRVGPTGQPFAVGAAFKQPTAGQTGRLFLIVAPSTWGQDCAGSYKVKVRTEE